MCCFFPDSQCEIECFFSRVLITWTKFPNSVSVMASSQRRHHLPNEKKHIIYCVWAAFRRRSWDDATQAGALEGDPRGAREGPHPPPRAWLPARDTRSDRI